MARSPIDITGQKFGTLTAIRRVDAPGQSRWECECECGRKPIIRANTLTLKSRPIQSCGCVRDRNNDIRRTKHGQWQSPAYMSWSGVIQRCTNSNNNRFHHYGGRGITVCSRWLKFENFLADMGERPSQELTIDRINNDLGYWCGRSDCPDCGPNKRQANCRWATLGQQKNNMRRTCWITCHGHTLTMRQWQIVTGIPHATMNARFHSGMPHDQVLRDPRHLDWRRRLAERIAAFAEVNPANTSQD